MKRLLVALDASDNSSFVLARAIELARALGAKIRLVTAVQMPPIIPAPPVGPIYVDSSGAIDAAAERLRAREREIPEALRDGLAVELGLAHEVVCSVARTYDADLVVIGAHRHGILARMLGTTAAKIVNHIDRPVIVVRPMPTAVEAKDPGAVAAPAVPRKHDEHPLLETATLAGGATGAVVGAAAGPAGAVVGGVIGLGVGMLAGEVLDDEAATAGAPKRSSLDNMRAGAILRSDHARLEKIYEDLLAAYRSGDWDEVRAQWAVFEPAIRLHMDTEEQDVYPELRAVNQKEADALFADHGELRRLLGTIGVAIDLHAVPESDARELIARIRAHGAREEVLLYPWMDDALDVKKVKRLARAA